MKHVRIISLAVGALFLSATADLQANCCADAKKAGKECAHKCCEEAAKKKKTCEKCNGKAEKKEEKN
jgi:hypothetical protein